jgi:hypothetical protein
VTDTQRIDWLEQFINEHGAILLHDGNQHCRYVGLGLRPGLLVRTLREAIDGCADAAPDSEEQP